MQPANCGFEVQWSAHFRERYAGEPVKSVALRFGDTHLHSEFVISVYGVEGSGGHYRLTIVSAAFRGRSIM